MKFLIFVISAIMVAVRGIDTTSAGMNPRSTRYMQSSINKNNVGTLSVKWVTTLPGQMLSSPAVVGDRIYTGDQIGTFTALNKHTGEIIYQKNLTRDFGFANMTYTRTTPTYSNGLLVVPTSGRWGAPTAVHPDWGTSGGAWLMILNAADGSLLRMIHVSDFFRAVITGSPTVENGVIYIGLSSTEELETLASQQVGKNYSCCSFVGRAMAFSLSTGAKLWDRPMIPDELVGVGKYSGAAIWMSSPPILGDYIYYATGNLYEAPDDVVNCYVETNNNASCADPRVLFDAVVKLNKHTGEIISSFRATEQDVWHILCRVSGRAGCPMPPGFEGPDADFGNNPMLTKPDEKGNVYVAIGQKSGVFWYLNATDLSVVWKVVGGPFGNFGGFQYGSTMNDDNQIFGAQANSVAKNHTTIDKVNITYGSWMRFTTDGKIKWETVSPTKDPIPGALTSTNNVVFGSTMSGQFTALSAITGEILWSFTSGVQTMSGPSIDGDTIYWPAGYTVNFKFGAVPTPTKLYAFEISRH